MTADQDPIRGHLVENRGHTVAWGGRSADGSRVRVQCEDCDWSADVPRESLEPPRTVPRPGRR